MSLCLLTCIFPGKSDIQPESRHLEFEDVWLASQVEPLHDNFDVLGMFLLGHDMTKEIFLQGWYVTIKMDMRI